MPSDDIRLRLMSEDLDNSCPTISLPGSVLRRNTTKQKPALEISPLKRAMMVLGGDQDITSIQSSSGSKYHDRMSGMRKKLTCQKLVNTTEENKSEFRLMAIRESSKMLVEKYQNQ